MENLLLVIVALIVGAIIGYLYCKKQSNNNNEGNPNEKPPHGIISVDEAIELHENYVEKIKDTSQNPTNPNFRETQFVWFSMGKMRSYIEYLDNLEKVNPNNPKISGIRVYFGKYDNHNKYPQQQTVFFNPTIGVELNNEEMFPQDFPNMKHLPFSIIPRDGNSAIVGNYKIITELLLDDHYPFERAFEANNTLGIKSSQKESVHKSTAAARNGNGDKGTSASFNDGQLSPPPPRS